MTTNPNTLLKFANLQMAAEALFSFRANRPDEERPGGSTQSYLTINPADLTFGNNRFSRFTDVQATEFTANWEVVEHKSNTATGFSGTLFRYRGATDLSKGLTNGELVLSFRSTEFADDAARDKTPRSGLALQHRGLSNGLDAIEDV